MHIFAGWSIVELYFVEKEVVCVKTWQKVLMIVVSVIAAAAVAACGLLIWQQYKNGITAAQEASAAADALQAAEGERDAYRAEAEKKNTENDTLKQQMDELQKQLDELKKQQENLQNENASLKNQMALMAEKKTQSTTNPTTPPPTGNKVCYLTFDDGPSEVTLKILETLKKYNVKATFFVVGTGKMQYLSRIHADGHALALHCNNHTYSKVYASEAAYFADLAAISDKVQKVTGTKPMVVRFPGGSSNTASSAYTKGLMTALAKKLPEMGYAYFDWNVSSGDAGGANTAAAIRNNVLNGAKGKSSICVLMHDGGGKNATAAALPGIIEGLQKQGFTFEVLTPEVKGFKHGINN